MTLLHDIVVMACADIDRDTIAQALHLTREMVDWIMDSDSFAVALENFGGAHEDT